MDYLAERWDRLASIPRTSLVSAPTPVERLQGLSDRLGAELWVKRDDLTNARYGGNKIRKLEYLLGDAEAKQADTLITAGALGSHHVLATSLHGAARGLGVHACLVAQPWHAHVEQILRADLAAGAHLNRVRSYPGVPIALLEKELELRLAGHRPYRVAIGGSSPLGTVGYVQAGLELAAQVQAGALEEPEAIYCALGSGGTAAGLAIGIAAAGMETRIEAVRVTAPILANRLTLNTLIRRTVALLRREDRRFPRVSRLAIAALQIRKDQLGRGYGHPTESGERASRSAAEEGLMLDPTYTAKAFGALLKDAEGHRRGRPLLYVHTLSAAPMHPLLAGAPEIPSWARALAR